jgi:hypothetical protein
MFGCPRASRPLPSLNRIEDESLLSKFISLFVHTGDAENKSLFTFLISGLIYVETKNLMINEGERTCASL